MAQPAEVLGLPLTPDVLQGPAPPVNLTTRAVAATIRPRLLSSLWNGSLHGRCLGTDGPPGGNSAEPSGIEEGPPLSNVLGRGGWWRRAASITCTKPSLVVELLAQQWRTTDQALNIDNGQCSVSRGQWRTRSLLADNAASHENRDGKDSTIRERMCDASTGKC